MLADFEQEPWPVHLAYPSARQLGTRTRVFVDLLAADLRARLAGRGRTGADGSRAAAG